MWISQTTKPSRSIPCARRRKASKNCSPRNGQSKQRNGRAGVAGHWHRGVISALGRARDEFWRALAAGESGIRPMTLVPAGSVRFPNAAEVPDFRAEDHMDPKHADALDRFAQFALIAAREAVADSGIEFDAALGEVSGVITGSSLGGKSTEDDGFRGLYALNQTRFPPLSVPKAMANAGASRISLECCIISPVYTVSTACSSANHAIGQAFWMVRNGVAEVAIAGGSEAPFSLGHLKAWEAMRVVSPDTCRPFSRDRRGIILGEGAAMLVLEPLDRARARGVCDLGRNLRLRHVERRASPHAPLFNRRSPSHASGIEGCWSRTRFHRLHQRPRHRDRNQRSHRNRRHPRSVRP